MNAERQAYPEDDMALDLGGLLRAIGRSLRWLLPLTIGVAAAVFLALQFVAPKYQSQAQVLIESTDNKFPGASRGAEEERAVLDAEGVASQVQLLKSSDLARRVAKKLDLADVAEFNAQGDPSLIGSLLIFAGLASPPPDNSVEERVLKHFYKNLDVYQIDGTRVIAVGYTAESPVLAAKVANTIVDEFLELQSTAKRQTTKLASAALEPQILELRKDVQSARQAVADFRARADLLIGADNIPLNQQQLAETSSNYSAAQASKAEAQAKADLLRELLTSGGSLETASEVLNSALIQRLRERQVEIQSNIAELSITLLPNHPQLRSLQSQLADYDRQIRSEARKILQGLENDAKVANQQALALSARLDELKTAAAKSNSDQARLSELEREANAKAAQLDQLMLSFQEADSRLRAQVLPADARITSRASVPVEPVSPKILSSTIVAALVTFILGCAFVLMRAFLSGNALVSANGGQVAAPGQAPLQRVSREDSDRGFREPLGWSSNYGQTSARYGFAPGAAPIEGQTAPRAEGRPGHGEVAPVPEDGAEPMPEAPPQEQTKRVPEVAASKSRLELYDRNVAPDWVTRLRVNRDPDLTDMEAANEAGLPPAGGPAAKKDTSLPGAGAPDTSASGQAEQQDRDEEPSPDAPKMSEDGAQTAEDAAFVKDIEPRGRIVVLSVDDSTLSHELAFDLVRKAAKSGKSALVVEVFPELADRKAAEGFSDVVSGKMPFAKVVYRDARSKAHIIEAGRLAITDDMVQSDRFKLALDAIRTTYEVVVVDLGAIDGTLASARMLSFADRVFIAASAPDHSHELQSAANLLAHNTGARVDVLIVGGSNPDPRRNGDGHAA